MVGLLNALLSFEIVWPSLLVKPDARLAPEAVLVWVVAIAWVWRFGVGGYRVSAVLALGVALLATVFAGALVVANALGVKATWPYVSKPPRRRAASIAAYVCRPGLAQSGRCQGIVPGVVRHSDLSG